MVPNDTSNDFHEIWVAATPPSFNQIGMSGNRWKLAKIVKDWRQMLGMAMIAARVPRNCNRVLASAVITFPSRRRRDEENFRPILSKALGDALQDYGAIADDTAEFFHLDLRLEVQSGVSKTSVCLECS